VLISGVQTYNVLSFKVLVYCKGDLLEIVTLFIEGSPVVDNKEIETDPL